MSNNYNTFITYILTEEDPLSPKHKKSISLALKGKSKPESVKKKISDEMKGKSNFEGEKHTNATKKEIGRERGSRDPIKNKKWNVNKFTGETIRKEHRPSQAWLFKRRSVRQRDTGDEA